MSTTEALLRYDDMEKFVEQQDAVGGGGRGSGAAGYGMGTQPVSESWLRWHVRVPSRLALFTMASIIVYEVLVAVSMGVRVLRFVMVSWLGWMLLAFNVLLLILLTAIVLYHKVDCSRFLLRRSAGTAESKQFDE